MPKTSAILELVKSQSDDVISLAGELYAAARAGTLPNFAVVVKHGGGGRASGMPDISVGIAGSFKRDLLGLIGALEGFKEHVHELRRESVHPSMMSEAR